MKLGLKLKNAVKKNAASRWLWCDDALMVLSADRSCLYKLKPHQQVQMDSAEHVRGFEQTEKWFSKDAFVNMAQKRISHGTHMFSLLDEGILASFVWIQPQRDRVHFSEVDHGFLLPPRSGTSFHGYTHPRFRGKGHFKRCYETALHWVFGEYGNDHMFTAVDPENKTSLHINHTLGFRPHTLLKREIRFGRERKTAELLTP